MTKQEILCINCKHEIVKRKGVWKHKCGGTYCGCRWNGNKPLLGGCKCSLAGSCDGGRVVWIKKEEKA